MPKTTPRVLLICWLAFCAVAAFAEPLERAAPESLGFSEQRLERLSESLQAYVDDGRIAGSVTLVARRGRIAYLESFGDRDVEARSEMRDDTIFRIASQTKAIVSTAVMLLQEEGKLLIEDPVGKHMPEFEGTTVAVPRDSGGFDVVPAEQPITIRHLLTHTSGFDYGTGPAADLWREAGIQGYYFADRDDPIGDTVARMAKLPASAHPGERWIYGYSTDILGALVERVSGTPLDEFLDERLFEPLGMTDTHFYLPAAKRDRLAAVYGMREGKLTRAPDGGGAAGQGTYVDGPRKSFSGGAGLLSTAGDYARFLQMLLGGGELDGRRILSPKTVELMTVDHLGDVAFRPGQGFGLGFSILEDVGARGTPGSAGEYGWGGAYHSTYWVDPVEELVVVHLTQLIPTGDIDDFAKVRALLYQALVE